MTKQEEIQRYLEDVINKAWRLGKEGKGIDLTGEAKASMNQLSLWGVVLKVERELPHKMPYVPNNEWSAGYCCGEEFMQDVMLEAGFTSAIEPLINEM